MEQLRVGPTWTHDGSAMLQHLNKSVDDVFVELGKVGGGCSWHSLLFQAWSLLRTLHKGSKARALQGVGEVLKLHSLVPCCPFLGCQSPATTITMGRGGERGLALQLQLDNAVQPEFTSSGAGGVRRKSERQDQPRGVMESQWRSRTQPGSGRTLASSAGGACLCPELSLLSPGTSGVWASNKLTDRQDLSPSSPYIFGKGPRTSQPEAALRSPQQVELWASPVRPSVRENLQPCKNSPNHGCHAPSCRKCQIFPMATLVLPSGEGPV